MTGVDFLCEDLLLVAIDAGHGRLDHAWAISYGLMGAELVRLAAAGRITVADDQILISSAAPAGDAELDAALARIGEWASPPRPDEWVARPRLEIPAGYLRRLEAAGVIQAETETRWGWQVPRYRITGAARVAQARQQLDAIAASTGPIDPGQAAYAGLACATGLHRMLYRGWRGRAGRRRLREIAAGHWTTSTADDAQQQATQAAVSAATLAAVSVVRQAAKGAGGAGFPS